MVSVTSSSLGQIAGMPDVDYDFEVSSSLRTAFTNAANTLQGQRASRANYRKDGGTDFEGHFSQVFTDNGTQQLLDLDEIVTNLKLVASKVLDVETAAREENGRRAQARAWAERLANRNGWDKFWDSLFGEEDPPVTTLTDSGPSNSVTSPAPKQPQTPAPGSGGGSSGGSSSARPQNLRNFATSTRSADEELASYPGSLTEHCSSFTTSCSWATLDASSVISAFSSWLSANGQDAQWADVVAQAFENAGGEGVITLPDAAIAAALQSAGVAESRTDIEVDPPTAHGSPPTTGYSNDPVNTATGNFLENETDLGFTGPAASLVWSRLYNSMDPGSGAFGPGWSSWAECGLVIGDDTARFRLPDGRVVVFPREGTGWGRAVGENLWLEQTQHGLRISTNTGLAFELSTAGAVLAVDGGPGTRVTFERHEGRLTRLSHEFGRWLTVVWEGERIAAVVASDGRRVDYCYDEAGRLVAAAGPTGVRSYGWNDEGFIATVTDADGVVEAANTYDERGRVTTQVSQHGRTTHFSYVTNRVTVVADADGSRANTWLHDSRGRLVGVVDAEGNRQSTGYDRHGNPAIVTERDGSTTVRVFDERGRCVTQQGPSGARQDWVFDDRDRVTEVSVEADGERAVTRYSYDGEDRNPSLAVDPSGGETRFTWRRGLLTEVVDPTGVRVAFTHDEHGDLIATTDALGNTARLERDAAGRVVAAITPLGHRTTYRYDETTGVLISRIDPAGATTRFEHSAAGRITAVIDPTGARTVMAYGDDGERHATTDALGRTMTSSHDDLGRLSAVELPDGSTWSFGYDLLSRLVESTDATGGTWRMEFGPTGYLTSATDATGVRREVVTDRSGLPLSFIDGDNRVDVVRDQLGRIVFDAGADGEATTRRFDACGRVVESVDPEGGVTRIMRDAAGRVVAVTQPMGRTFHYEYDAAGRWAATISTGGQRYEVTRDADGRIARESWPNGDQVMTTFDVCGRIVERVEPGRGRIRFRYDKAGRIVGIRDPWNGKRSFAYDEAGQLVAATNALGGVTRFEYNELGQQVAVIDPMGGRTERTFDQLGRVLTATDPLGRVTRYSYDATGRPVRRVDPDPRSLEWRYERGRRTMTLADGKVLSSVERDPAARTMRVVEGETVHELAWNTTGQLLSRLRNGVGVRYDYDANGRRTTLERPDGSVTRYEYDGNGRVSALEHPGVGRAVLERDALGRVVSLAADGLHATWAYADGLVVEHRLNRRGFLQATCIERDADGRVLAQVRDGLRTEYSYDDAGQLTGGRTSEGSEFCYEWDANGRLVAETADGRTTRYSYDAGGQLLLATAPDGSRTEYAYDGSGRRVRERGPSTERHFAWDPQGFLARITAVRPDGDRMVTATQRLRVDALGELDRIDDTPVYWDSASAAASIAQIGATVVVNALAATALTAAGGGDAAWVMPDSHGRDTGAGSPWGLVQGLHEAGQPQGTSVTSMGGVNIGGLEWMQARTYDPTTHGFLSTDPWPPVAGTG